MCMVGDEYVDSFWCAGDSNGVYERIMDGGGERKQTADVCQPVVYGFDAVQLLPGRRQLGAEQGLGCIGRCDAVCGQTLMGMHDCFDCNQQRVPAYKA